MSAVFPVSRPLELAYTRTRAPHRRSARSGDGRAWSAMASTVSVEGLDAEPIVSARAAASCGSKNRARTPLELRIESRHPAVSSRARSGPAAAAATAAAGQAAGPGTSCASSSRRPRAYPFDAGRHVPTAARSSVNGTDDPPVGRGTRRAAAVDRRQPGRRPVWMDAREPFLTPARTATSPRSCGSRPNQIARADAQQRMRVRVAATHAGTRDFRPSCRSRSTNHGCAAELRVGRLMTLRSGRGEQLPCHRNAARDDTIDRASAKAIRRPQPNNPAPPMTASRLRCAAAAPCYGRAEACEPAAIALATTGDRRSASRI